MFFYYKGFSCIPEDEELLIYKSGILIAAFPITKKIMDTFDIVEKIEEVLDM